jgi:hypothetical protein
MNVYAPRAYTAGHTVQLPLSNGQIMNLMGFTLDAGFF